MSDLFTKWIEQELGKFRKWQRGFGTYVYDRFRTLSRDINGLIDDIHSVQNSITDIKDWARGEISTVQTAILSAVRDDLIKPLSSYVDALKMDVRDAVNDIDADIRAISKDMSTVFDVIDTLNDRIDERIEGFKDKVVGWIQDKFISIVENVLEQEIKQ